MSVYRPDTRLWNQPRRRYALNTPPSPRQLVAFSIPVTQPRFGGASLLFHAQLTDPSQSDILRTPAPLARRGSDAFPSIETAPFHHAARRRGSDVAVRGARAAAREDAPHRHTPARSGGR